MPEPLWVMMRILAVCAAVVLSYILYRVSSGVWDAYKSGQYSLRSARGFRFRTRQPQGAGAVYQHLEFQDDEDDEALEGPSDGLLGEEDEGYHDAESVASGSSKPPSPILLQKPLPERPLPDKPLPPVPREDNE